MQSADTPPGLFTIERVVAFILGPAVTAASGWLSLFLAKKWGIHIEGPEIAGIFSAGALSAAGLAYKWLHGKQVEMKATAYVAAAEHAAGSIPGASAFIHTTVADLEGLAQHAATQAVEHITGVKASPPDAGEAGDAAPTSQADGAAIGQ